MATRVFAYKADVEDRDAVNRELRAANDYARTLVLIHRKAFDSRSKLISADPDVGRLEAEIEKIEAEVEAVLKAASKDRSRERSRRRNPEATAALKGAKERKKAVLASLREARKGVRQGHKAADDELTRRISERLGQLEKSGPTIRGPVRKQILSSMLEEPEWSESWRAERRIDLDRDNALLRARAECGLFHGTYVAVEDSIKASVKDSAKRHKPPRWPNFDGTGRIGCQVGKESVERVTSGNSFKLRIDPLPEDTWETRSGRRHAKTRVLLRTGSKDRQPVWTRLTILQHRPLPPDAEIRWAYLVVRREGHRSRYELQITIDTAPANQEGDGRVAVDLGWRRMSDGSVRVGVAIGTDGIVDEIRIPACIEQRLDHASALHGANDRLFEKARAVLYAWLKAHAGELPDWCEDFVKHERDEDNEKIPIPREEWTKTLLASVPQWRSHQRMRRMCRRLANHYFGSNEPVHRLWEDWKASSPPDLWPEIESAAAFLGLPVTDTKTITWWLDLWQRKSDHLYRWERDVATRALSHRREIFRIASRRLARRYALLVLEDFDLRAFCVKAPVDQEESIADDNNRAARVRAAPGEFRSALIEAFGAAFEKRKCAYTTVACNKCLSECVFDAAKQLRHKCEHCGAHWDQDLNACRNLLSERFSDRYHPEIARGAKKKGERAQEALREQAAE